MGILVPDLIRAVQSLWMLGSLVKSCNPERLYTKERAAKAVQSKDLGRRDESDKLHKKSAKLAEDFGG